MYHNMTKTDVINHISMSFESVFETLVLLCPSRLSTVPLEYRTRRVCESALRGMHNLKNSKCFDSSCNLLLLIPYEHFDLAMIDLAIVMYPEAIRRVRTSMYSQEVLNGIYCEAIKKNVNVVNYIPYEYCTHKLIYDCISVSPCTLLLLWRTLWRLTITRN